MPPNKIKENPPAVMIESWLQTASQQGGGFAKAGDRDWTGDLHVGNVPLHSRDLRDALAGLDINRVCGNGEYLTIYCPTHPKAWKNPRGYIYLHRIVAELKLGRLLRDDEQVHHVDKKGRNDEPDNIEIHDAAAHSSVHLQTNPKRLKLECACCGVLFERCTNQLLAGRAKHQRNFCTRRCMKRLHRREYRARKRAAA